jgi:3-oxoadipate enol-lactonase
MKLGHRFDGDPSAPVLVFAGSLGSTLAMWEPQLPLGERFRILRYDYPGHGSSPPAGARHQTRPRRPWPVPGTADGPISIGDLGAGTVALLDELELERVSFCGLSLGGMVAMWLASHAPNRIDRLVLCCTSARLRPPEQWAERAALVRREGMAAVADTVVERWFTPRFRASQPAVVARYRAMLLATDAESYARCCEAIRDLDLRDDLGAIAAPTVILAAAEDPSTPVEHAEAIARGIGRSRLIVVPDAAHLANVEQPEAVNRALLEHLGVAQAI